METKNVTAQNTRTSARDRLRDWRPDTRHSALRPGESLPPSPRTPAAIQSLRVWGSRDTYFPRIRKRYGDTFTLNVTPFGKLVVVCGLEDVRKVALGSHETFPIGDGNALLTPILGNRSVVALDGNEHRAERKRMMPAFHGDRIAAVISILERLTEEEVARWPVGSTFSMVERMRDLALRLIIRVVMGVEEEDRADRFFAAMRHVIDIKTLDLLMWVWPRLAGFGRWRTAIRRLQEADDLLYEEIARRRADPDRQRRPDVLSMLLDGDPDDELVRDELVTLLTGGHETTAVASAWMFERLVRHPEVVDRLRAGLDQPKDEYRKAVIKETLRVRPVNYNVGRKTTQPVEVGGHLLPAGTFVWPVLRGVQVDRAIWGDDAEVFRPERWLEPDLPAQAYLPFGGGVHRCLGSLFAEAEMEVFLRVVLRLVDLRPDRSEDEPSAMRNIIVVPGRGARVKVARRIG